MDDNVRLDFQTGGAALNVGDAEIRQRKIWVVNENMQISIGQSQDKLFVCVHTTQR